MHQVAPGRPACYDVAQQIASTSVTGPRPASLGNGCTQPALGGSGPLCFPIDSNVGQRIEAAGLPVQENPSKCSRVAQHALLLEVIDHVESDPTVPNLLTQPSSQISHR